MGKRNQRGGDSDANPRKRQKTVHEVPSSEEIYTSRQLQQLLAFDQDVKKVRHGLQSFKVFLDGLLDEERDRAVQAENFGILKAYLEATKPKQREDEDETAIYLQDVMETWNHASQLNNDGLLSAVPVVLHLLLKLLSRSLETLPYALGIGRALLQKPQQELIAWNLSADRSQEFIISPTLRMLREAVCLDGGALAGPIFRARSCTFKALGRNLGIRYVVEGVEDARRTSVRTNAVRFLLGALKYLHAEAKKELLAQKDVVAALTKSVKDDPPHLKLEMLDTLKTHVLRDDRLPRDTKSRFLNSMTLARMASLYALGNSTSTAEESSEAPSIDDAVHDFLLTACTVPSSGVLRQDDGFYPRGTEQEDVPISDSDWGGLTLEQLGWFDKFSTEIPIRNIVLADFMQSLRPWSNIRQSELIMAIFRAAPELVAHYFVTKSFTFDPKLSATWIGYAAFLFNAVALPVPEFFGRRSGYSPLPPPTSVVIDNILPAPLSQKALSRCFTGKSNLASFFAARILVVAIEKLDRVVKLHAAATQSNGHLWQEASRRLVEEFCRRTPGIQDMINSYRAIPEDDVLHREAASRLLRLYYEIIPHDGLLAKFDVSPFLEKAVAWLGERHEGKKKDEEEGEEEEGEGGGAGEPQDRVLKLMELENLLAASMYSPGMRWFSKTENMDLSPFTAFLKVYVDAPKGVSLSKLIDVLSFVAEEQKVVSSHSTRRRLLPLLESLARLKESSLPLPPASTNSVWVFLDNCLSRCAAAPAKYEETLLAKLDDNHSEQSSKNKGGRGGGSKGRVSLVALSMLEQLPFFVQSAATTGDDSSLQAVARFLGTFFTHSALIGEDRQLLKTLLAEMRYVLPEDSSPSRALMTMSDKMTSSKHGNNSLAAANLEHVDESTLQQQEDNGQEQRQDALLLDDGALTRLLQVPDSLAPENSALVRWAAKSVDELVDEGYAVSLIALLASEHTSIRKEALVNLLKMAAKVQQSEHDEKEQVWLLLSELAETAKGHVDASPLPSPVVAFACHALAVLKNPLHCLYAKVNTFLTRGPSWRLDQVPLVLDIVQEEPLVDDTFYAQLGWLTAYLTDCLRTPADVQLFHRMRLSGGPLFERLLALRGFPYMRAPLRTQVLSVLYRATTIEGGSTTLMTRFGVVAWLEVHAASGATPTDEAALCWALIRRIVATGGGGGGGGGDHERERERVAPWKRRGFLDYPGVEGVAAG